MPTLGNGTFQPQGASQTSTVNSLLTQAFNDNNAGVNVPKGIYTNSPSVTAQDQDVLGYLSGGGENVSASSCRVH
jgi:hypothetical protein